MVAQSKSDIIQLTTCDSGPRDVSTIKWLVVHTFESPRESGAAALKGRAAWQQADGSGSYHKLYSADGLSLRANDIDFISWSAHPTGNRYGVHYSALAYAADSRSTWLAYGAQLRAMARDIAYEAKLLGIPLVKISAADMRAGARGICGHADVSAAFRESDHTDPGNNFPWDVFMQLVREEAGVAPTKAPAKPQGGSTMAVLTGVSAAALNDSKVAAIESRAAAVDTQIQMRGPGLRGWAQLDGCTVVDALSDVKQQIRGPLEYTRDQHGRIVRTRHVGWGQLGNRTLVDGVAAILETMVGPVELNEKGRAVRYKGWKQLGTRPDGKYMSMVDAIADIRQRVVAIEETQRELSKQLAGKK